MEGPVKKQKRELEVDASPSSGSTATTVDTRKRLWTLGFEWDLNGFNIYTDEACHQEGLPPKLVIDELPDPGVRAENDSGHVEFISEPFNAEGCVLSDTMKNKPFAGPREALGAQIEGIRKLLQRLPNEKCVISCMQREKGCGEIKFVFLKRAGTSPTGRPQVTVGITLSRIPDILKSGWVKAKDNVGYVLENFAGVNRHPDALGFLSLLNYYFCTLPSARMTTEGGPKLNFNALARNSFRGLYLALGKVDQKYVDKALKAHYQESQFDQPLFPKGYRTDAGAVFPALSILYSEWVHSILDPEAGRKRFMERLGKIKGFGKDLVADSLVAKKMDTDLLSPPPFFDPNPQDGVPYAMGRYGEVKDGLALFELRGITDKNLNLTTVEQLILKVIDFLNQAE